MNILSIRKILFLQITIFVINPQNQFFFLFTQASFFPVTPQNNTQITCDTSLPQSKPGLPAALGLLLRKPSLLELSFLHPYLGLLYASCLCQCWPSRPDRSIVRRVPHHPWTTFAVVKYLTFRLLLRCLRSRTARSLARLPLARLTDLRASPHQGKLFKASAHEANALDTLLKLNEIVTVVPIPALVIIKSRYCKPYLHIKEQSLAFAAGTAIAIPFE